MIDLTVKTLDSHNHAFNVDENITVVQFKQKVFEKINIPVETQRIIYCGRVLKDEHKLSEYDLNGKVVHLVQRAPPSAGGPSNTTTGQRRSRSISPSSQHRRRTPGGNTMYVGSMSFPANFVEGFIPPPPPPTHTLAASRLNVARRMLSLAESRLASHGGNQPTTGDSTAAAPSVNPLVAAEGQVIEMQIVSGGIESAIDWFENLENDYIEGELRQPRSSTPVQPESTTSTTPVQAAATINQPPQIEDDDDVEDQRPQHQQLLDVEVAFIDDDHEPDDDHVEIVAGPEPSMPVSISVDTSGDLDNTNMTVAIETQTVTVETTGSDDDDDDDNAEAPANARPTTASSTAGSSTTNGQNAAATGSNICRTSAMATHLDTLQRIHQNFAPLLERYHTFMRDDPVVPPEDIDSTQSMLEQVSDVLHLLGHAYHSLSDIIVRAYATPPRALLCCPILVHSGVMHSSLPLPIQLEAQINFNHSGTNGGRNGLNQTTGAQTPAAGQQQGADGPQSAAAADTGHPTTTRIGIPIDANALTAQLAPILASVAAAVQQQQQQHQQQQQQAQQQQQSNTSSSSTATSTTTSSSSSSTSSSSTTGSSNAPGARVTGVYGAAAAGGGVGGNRPLYRMQTGGGGNSGLNGLGNVEYSIELLDDLPVDGDEGGQPSESVSTTTAAAETSSSTAARASTGNNGRGQNSQARGNTTTNPTTTQATRTRSTSRPHVHMSTEHAVAAAALNNLFGGHGHGEPLFDPYLRCSSHHLHHQRNNNNNNVGAAANAGQQSAAAGQRRSNNVGGGGPVLAAGHVQLQMHGPRRLGGQQGGRARVRGQTGSPGTAAQSRQSSNTSSPTHQQQQQQRTAAPPMAPPPPGISLPPGMNASAIYQMAQGLMDNIQTVFAGAGAGAAPAAATGTQQQQQTTGTPPAGAASGGQPDWLRGLLDTFAGAASTDTATANQQNPQGRGESNAGAVPLLLSQAVGRMMRDLQSVPGGAVPAGGSILIDQGGVRFHDMMGLFPQQQQQQQQSSSRNPQQQPSQNQPQQSSRHSESVIDSFYTLIRRNLTLQDIFSLSTGNLDLLQRFRSDIRTLVLTQLLNNSTTPEAIDRGVNIVLDDLQPYLHTLSFMSAADDIDIVASVTSLVRARLPNILQLAASPRTDNSRSLADQLRTTVQQTVALLIHVNADGVPGLERFVEHNVNQVLRNFPESFRRTTLQDLHQRFVAPFTAQAASVPDSLLQPYLVRRGDTIAHAAAAAAATTTSATTAAAAAVAKITTTGAAVSSSGPATPAAAAAQPIPATNSGGTAAANTIVMETIETMDVDDELPEGATGGCERRTGMWRSNLHAPSDADEDEDRIIDAVRSGQGLWQSQLPQDWVPIITRDMSRQQQRRPSDSNSDSDHQTPLSDAYLSGMPSKRRKLVTDAKPQLHNQNGNGTSNGNSLQLQRVISEGVRRAVSHTVVGQRGDVMEGVAEEVAGDAGVQAAYRDLVRASVAASVRGNVDLTEERFPNACKYFMSSEVNKPNIP